MPKQTMFDEVANDLAIWIDETAEKVAIALAPRSAPFAVNLTEAQKLEVYTRQLFNPDGSPNTAGRAKELARLGPEQFAQVYKAVVRAHPELRPRMPDANAIDTLAPPVPQAPGMPPGPPPAAGPPAGPPPGMPPGPPMPMPPVPQGA